MLHEGKSGLGEVFSKQIYWRIIQGGDDVADDDAWRVGRQPKI